jgi:hypothetical protein
MLDEKVAVVSRSSRGSARGGDEATMASHTLGTRDEWLAARLDLLEAEKELTRRSDELARQRRDLPWVRVEKDYRFATGDGDASLRDLFGGRSQMLVYHFEEWLMPFIISAGAAPAGMRAMFGSSAEFDRPAKWSSS